MPHPCGWPERPDCPFLLLPTTHGLFWGPPLPGPSPKRASGERVCGFRATIKNSIDPALLIHSRGDGSFPLGLALVAGAGLPAPETQMLL